MYNMPNTKENKLLNNVKTTLNSFCYVVTLDYGKAFVTEPLANNCMSRLQSINLRNFANNRIVTYKMENLG